MVGHWLGIDRPFIIASKVAFELQTYFRSLLLSPPKITSIGGRYATTRNTSAVRRLSVRISKGLFTWRWGTQIGEVNCSGGEKNNMRFAFTCNRTTPPPRGALSEKFWMVAKHVHLIDLYKVNTAILQGVQNYWGERAAKQYNANGWLIELQLPAKKYQNILI